MNNYRGHRYSAPRQAGNFSRSAAALKYYSYSSNAAKVSEERDEVSLKYYSKMVKIENRKAARNSFAKITCSLIVCLCAIVMIFARSAVYGYQLKNDSLRKELEEAREKTASIIAQNTEKMDIEYVEEQARTRLNMSKPQSYQIVYIDVPKTDYTVSHGADTVIEKERVAFISYRDVVSSIFDAKDIILADRNDDK